jgi:rare lipoprotein A
MQGCVRPWTSHFGLSVLALGLAIALSGCASTDGEVPAGDNGGYYKVGSPYQIKGVWYYPKEEPGYDETGIASWYGDYFHGRKTANGEIYNMNSLTAAHRTLPLPSYVDVTNLDNGKQIRLRVNDRGPYARGRIIDVSKRAAEILGFKDKGVARVRVTFAGRVKGVGPTSQAPVTAAPLAAVSVNALSGTSASKEIKTASLGPSIPLGEGGVDPLEGQVRQVAVPASTQIWIQTGAFEQKGNATRQAAQLRTAGAVALAEARLEGRTVYRVRLGPIANVETADSKLDQVIGMGFNGAQVIVD